MIKILSAEESDNFVGEFVLPFDGRSPVTMKINASTVQGRWGKLIGKISCVIFLLCHPGWCAEIRKGLLVPGKKGAKVMHSNLKW